MSTDDTDQQSSLTRQRAAAIRSGVDPSDLLLEVESGRNCDRPQWLALLEQIRTGKVSTVWADRSDRLARDLFATRQFFALCTRTGTAWKFWSESWLDSDAPGAEELRQRAAFDSEMESRRIGTRLRRHYQHAMANAIPKARRAPLGLRLEGRGEERCYVIDDRHLAGSWTVADAARRLVALYLESGTIWTGVSRWKEEIQALEPVHLPEMVARCQRFNRESVKEWLELTAAELQGHLTRERFERIESEDGSSKPTYRRLNWTQWELTRETHPALVDAPTARRVLDQLAANHNRGLATARGKERAKPADHLASFTAITFCGCCGRRLRQQSTRAGKGPNGIPYRTLRCSGSGRAMGQCSQPGISERSLVAQLIPFLAAQADQVAANLHPAPAAATGPDPALVIQLEQTRALAASTGLPELAQAVLRLEAQVEAAAATLTQEYDDRADRLAQQQALAQWIKGDPQAAEAAYTVPWVRRFLIGAIERIEIQERQITAVTVAPHPAGEPQMGVMLSPTGERIGLLDTSRTRLWVSEAFADQPQLTD